MPSRIDVRGLRRSLGMSTEDLADQIGVHARTIERWESGKVAPSPLAIGQLRALQRPSANANPARKAYEPPSESDAPSAPMGGVVPSRRVS